MTTDVEVGREAFSPPTRIGSTRGTVAGLLIAAGMCAVAGLFITSPELGAGALACAGVLAVLVRYGSAGLAALIVVALCTLARFASTIAVAGIPIVIPLLVIVGFLWRASISEALRRSRLLRIELVLVLGWCAWNVVRLAVDVPIYGVLALRDGLIAFSSLAVVVGGAAAVRYRRSGIDRFLRALAYALAGYAVLYLARGMLPAALVPVFEFSNISVSGGALFAAGLWGRGTRFRLVCLLAGLAAVIVSQGRMIYLVVAAMTIVFLIVPGLRRSSHGTAPRYAAGLGKRVFGIAAVACIAAGGVILLGSIPGLQGRTATVSFASLSSGISSISLSPEDQKDSVADRDRWWAAVTQRLSSDPETALTGLGLGVDLLDGYRGPDGELVRKPHNDYLETAARYGVEFGALLLAFVGIALPAASRALRSPGTALLGGWLFGALANAYAQPYLAYPHGIVPVALATGYLIVSSTGASGTAEQATSVRFERDVSIPS